MVILRGIVGGCWDKPVLQLNIQQRSGMAGPAAISLCSTERGVFTHNSYSSIRQPITLPATASVATLRWWHLYGSAEAITTDPGTVGDRGSACFYGRWPGLIMLQRGTAERWRLAAGDRLIHRLSGADGLSLL